MSRPTVAHTGFLIPNAKDVASTVLAEPDKIDFNTIANARWGVVEGCEVTPQGGNLISVAAGTAVVNGKLVKVNPVSNVQVTVPNARFRFDLIVVNEAGTVQVRPGDQLDDPVYPDPQPNETVLAAVYCTSTASDYSNNIIDKRKFLSASLFAKMPTTDELIRNVNNTGNHYKVLGDGTTTWEDDTILKRVSAQTLEVTNNFRVLQDLYVGDDIRGLGSIKIDDYVESQDLQRGTSVPLSGTPGDLFRNTTTGRIYLWVGPAAGGAWQEMSTSASSVPVGTIITSLAPPASLRPFGWCPLDGGTYLEDEFPGLFTIPALLTAIIAGPEPRGMVVPNLSKRMLMVDPVGGVNKTGGANDGMVTLTVANMPKHKHNVGGTSKTTSQYAGFTPNVKVDATSGGHPHTIKGGRHQHRIVDPGHRHAGALEGVAAQVVTVDPSGQNKLDALFNDSSHTFSVTPATWTMPHVTNIAVSGDLSDDHPHTISGGAHEHEMTIPANQGQHAHTITEDEVGAGTGFSVMPAYYTCYAYIKG